MCNVRQFVAQGALTEEEIYQLDDQGQSIRERVWEQRNLALLSVLVFDVLMLAGIFTVESAGVRWGCTLALFVGVLFLVYDRSPFKEINVEADVKVSCLPMMSRDYTLISNGEDVLATKYVENSWLKAVSEFDDVAKDFLEGVVARPTPLTVGEYEALELYVFTQQ